MFVDDWLIESMDGVGLKLHHPVPREIALELNKPWEGRHSFDPVVIKNEHRYKLWYRGLGDVDPEGHTAYAESEDGIHWTRPSLGIHEFRGTRDNNVVIGSSPTSVCVFKDANPEALDSERYKAIGRGKSIDGRDTLRGMVSPDGLHWEIVEKDPIILAPDDGTRPWFDSHSVAFWDVVCHHYVAYMRGFKPPHVRAIRRSVSDDFLNWTAPEFIDLGDTPVEDMYQSACTQYFRARHHYLMFPMRFVPYRKFHQEWHRGGISDSVFMTSRDGVHWDRRFMEAFLRPGPNPDNWTDRNMYIGVGVVPTTPAEMSVYFMEHYRRLSVRLRRATLRTDGFVSVHAPYSSGEFVTRLLTFDGGELVLNYSTSVVGRILVEIQDAQGRPVDGYRITECAEIYGDEIERVVVWQPWRRGSDVSPLAGKPVRIRFEMKDADLYSIRFR